MSVAFEDMSEYAQRVVTALGLEEHPEGGWYRQTWLSEQAAAGVATRQGTEADPKALKAMKATEGRPLASLIYFLLAEGDASAWHKVDATEIWLWHGPATVGLELGGYGDAPADEDGRTLYALGQGLAPANPAQADAAQPEAATPDASSAPIGQVVIPEGCWQRTVPGKGDALVSCVVSPGFTFDGFTLE
ncbi:cupin domain-containing protein [Bifidobacterium sp. ESL0790]|uniref:cupin domain-containing protein n=1 Tax=Bifidobacterium sp. ESL0790 TaxID=2983233 RepID=UPI0023F7504D|nr:cupin domain-containing protein [Bifidobacterium sp. ESL0790]WEV72070.1 cupin domain-containing protein [Bifidobacterium sp. ESL0790]